MNRTYASAVARGKCNFTRTESRATRHSSGTYTQHTFPIKLAYVFTAHKAQGKTIDKPCVIDAEATWEAGQLYVVLSRVMVTMVTMFRDLQPECSADLSGDKVMLTIAGNLMPEMFWPICVPGLNG